MNNFKITLGAMALTLAAVAIVACSKEKTAQQEVPAPQQQTVAPNDYTLAEMIETMSWEEGKGFFENQPIKDYTELCRKVIADQETIRNVQDPQYEITWYWPSADGDCNTDFHGLCSITKKDTINQGGNARGCFEDGKLIIIPTTEEDGFTADGYLAIGRPIEVENDTVIIKEGVYAAYYDETLRRYVAVTVDIDSAN